MIGALDFFNKNKYKIFLQYFIFIGTVLSTFSTVFFIRDLANFSLNDNLIYLIYTNLIFLIAIVVIIINRLIKIFFKKKQKSRGNKLHVYLITILSILGIGPAIVVAFFSTLFFNSTLKTVFSTPFKNTINSAVSISDNYLKEMQKMIKMDAIGTASQLKTFLNILIKEPDKFNQILNQISQEKNLDEVLIFDNDFEIVARSFLTFALALETITYEQLQELKAKGILIFNKDNKIRALISIDNEHYLFIGRSVSQDVLDAVSRAKGATIAYNTLEKKQKHIQITFLSFFIALLVLLIAMCIWIGIITAQSLFEPISKLINAAYEISSGNLNVKIHSKKQKNEVDDLIYAFNYMANRLKKQTEELIFTQKKSAWADVARRIAHEIKNPLTPIKLSAERLKRKYLNHIENDQETFKTCIDTIIRQVDHIGNMVNEFSNFARMPEAKMQKSDIVSLAYETFYLQKQAYKNIDFIFKAPDSFIWNHDAQQISQVITNLLQNAVNSLLENDIINPQIILELKIINNKLFIIIDDNGIGFKELDYNKLTEPYYTTRKNGTGLGLAIASKITIDHNGSIIFENNEFNGARVILQFDIIDKQIG